MKISNLGLSAFLQTASTLNVTQAAKDLGLTQSALSQRIALLEEDLEVTLFIREPRGFSLTESGRKLLSFALMNQRFEEELLQEFKGHGQELAGSLRIGAYSSVLRSVIVPALTSFLKSHPKVHIDFQGYEMHELPNVLKTARADLVVMDYVFEKKNISTDILGKEEFVVIESKNENFVSDIYLDHGPEDNATEDFFKTQSKITKVYERSFMGDVYGIIDGVELGLGRAVMSKHLIANNKKVKQVKGYNIYKRPVTLHYFQAPFYSKLMTKVIAELNTRAVRYLES